MGLGMSALRGEADEDQRPSELPLIAISGPKDECQKSQTFQNRLHGNLLESVQISLGILRISGSPQKGTEKGSFPYRGQASGFDLVHCARPQPLVDFRPIGPFGLCVPLLQADEAKGEALLRIPEKASKTKKNNARNHDLTLSALWPRSVCVGPGEAASGPHDRMGDSI